MTHPCTETFSQGTTVKYLTLEVNVTAVNNRIQKTIGMIAIKYTVQYISTKWRQTDQNAANFIAQNLIQIVQQFPT